MDVRLPGNDYRVATLPKSCQRNHHAKFEICRTILTFINDKRYLLQTYEWTDPSCRKSSLLKINSKHGLIKKCISDSSYQKGVNYKIEMN